MIYGALTPNLNADLTALFSVSAERQGFEPRVPRSTTVFKTAAIDHSATSPKLRLRVALFFKSAAKVNIIFYIANVFVIFSSIPFRKNSEVSIPNVKIVVFEIKNKIES